MPQGVFRLRSAVLSAHLTCLSILQTVLPPAALSRFRGTGHSDRIQTLRALPSLCALSTTPEIPAPIQARSPEIRFPRDAQYMKIPRNPTGTLRFSAETRIAGGTSTRSCPRFPSPTDSAEKCGVSAMRVRNQRDAQKPEKLSAPRDKMHPSAPEDFSKLKKKSLDAANKIYLFSRHYEKRRPIRRIYREVSLHTFPHLSHANARRGGLCVSGIFPFCIRRGRNLKCHFFKKNNYCFSRL